MEKLWQDYRFLTREMATFIARQELDLFYELQNQRIQLQAIIDETAGAAEYLRTPPGQELLMEVQAEDARIATFLRGSMNRLSQQRQVRHAYHPAYSRNVGAQTDFSG